MFFVADDYQIFSLGQTKNVECALWISDIKFSKNVDTSFYRKEAANIHLKGNILQQLKFDLGLTLSYL